MASITTVPPEIILLIAKNLTPTSPTAPSLRESWRALSSLSRTCTSFYSILTPLLFSSGAAQTREYPLINNPLHYSAATGNAAPIARLAAYGADTNARTEGGESALHLALPPAPAPLETSVRRASCVPRDGIVNISEREDTVKALIEAGADVNAVNLPPLNIITPLTLAMWWGPHGAYPIVERLLEAGADPFSESVAPWFRGRLFEETVHFGMEDVMVLLMQYGWGCAKFREAAEACLERFYKEKNTKAGERMKHWRAVVEKRRKVARKAESVDEGWGDADAMDVDGDEPAFREQMKEVQDVLTAHRDAKTGKEQWKWLKEQEQNLNLASLWLKGRMPWALERARSEEPDLGRDLAFMQRSEIERTSQLSQVPVERV